jgi:hypothetical protein
MTDIFESHLQITFVDTEGADSPGSILRRALHSILAPRLRANLVNSRSSGSRLMEQEFTVFLLKYEGLCLILKSKFTPNYGRVVSRQLVKLC